MTVRDPKGVHLRYANLFCELALKFPCSVRVRVPGGQLLNGKSMLGLLGACIPCGQELEILCDGEGEERALAELLFLADSLGVGEGGSGKSR